MSPSDAPGGKSIDEILWGAHNAVKACATDDKAYYDRGSCMCVGVYECPFQSKNLKVVLDGQKVVVCERYHPKLQKPDSEKK